MSEHTTRQILDMIEANGGPEGLDLSGCDLSGLNLSGLDLRGAVFSTHAASAGLWHTHFRDCCLRDADFTNALIQGAYFRHADLRGAVLRWADLEDVELRDADLRMADLYRARLKNTPLLGSRLEGASLFLTKFDNAVFSRRELGAHLVQENSAQYSEFLLHHYPEMSQEDLKDRLDGANFQAREICLALKSAWLSIGRYDDASWAYRRERRIEKLGALQKARDAQERRNWRQAARNYAKVAGDQLVEFICDYGESIGRVFGAMVVVWLLFALVYGLIAGVREPWQDTATGRIRHITRNPIHLLAFSLGAMTTLEPPGLEARDTIAMQVLTPLEALLGIALAGLLGFVAGNRIRRS